MLTNRVRSEFEKVSSEITLVSFLIFWDLHPDTIQFYIVSLTVVGCLVPYNDPDLLNGTGSQDANASPFVIAVKNASISVVPSTVLVGKFS
jgi:amino acid permease